jgi:thymidylate synthase
MSTERSLVDISEVYMDFTTITDPVERNIITQHRIKSQRNKDYILWDFDDNMKRVADTGFSMMDRTGTGCKYLPGVTTTIDISKRVPIPTRRKTSWKSMLKEYLWFLTGSDNIDDLNKMGSKVWDFWKDEEWATKNGFDPSSIGYGYGPNLIHAGGDLLDYDKNPGVNQIDYVLNELRTNPSSRRILIDFWRADKIHSQKIPACHTVYQWIVAPNDDGELKDLHCVMYCRSQDLFVGSLSTNLQGGTFYTYMLAQQVGMVPKTLTHCAGHAHVYNNHIDLLNEYYDRVPTNSPILHLTKRDSIYDYTTDDFIIEDYNPLPSMKVPVAV